VLDDVRVYDRALSATEVSRLAGPRVTLAEDGVAFDGETAFTLSGAGFGTTSGRVELVTTSDGSAPVPGVSVPSVAQTATAWSDTSIDVTVSRGVLPVGAWWVVVTDASGRRSVPFPVRVTAADGLVGWWPLDEPSGPSAADVSGWSNTGAVNGNPTRGVGGGAGTAYTFDPSSSVTVAAAPSLNALGAGNGNVTVAFWVRPGAPTGAWRPLVNKRSGWSDRMPGVWLHPWENRLHYRWATNQSGNDGLDSAGTLPTGQWSHVTLTKTGQVLRIYVNGALDASVSLGGVTAASDGPFELCWSGTCGGLDDVRAYDRALSDREVADLAGRWTPADLTAGTALWLDAGDPSTITTASGTVTEWRDKSGRGRHARATALASSQPAWVASSQNNLGAVSFDGIDDSLSLVGAPLASQQNTAFVVAATTASTNPAVGFPAREVISNWTSANTVTSYFLGVADATRVRFSDGFAGRPPRGWVCGRGGGRPAPCRSARPSCCRPRRPAPTPSPASTARCSPPAADRCRPATCRGRG
jgi:hypothetical protein